MDNRKAFDIIHRKIEANPRKSIVDSFFDESAFGNFWIAYEEDNERLSVVNDRGQLILCDGPAGAHFRAMLSSDLRVADEKAVWEAVC